MSAFDGVTIALLDTPLDPQRVSKRSGGGGKQFSYLEGWDVKQKANEIFGYGGWAYNVTNLTCLGEEEFTSSGGKTGVRVGYRATVVVSVGSANYGDVGYGDAQEYNGSRITPHELASKEAVTDALKRAFASLGDQFGLCLYDKEAPEHDGKNADPLASLKARVGQLAIEGGAEPTKEGVLAFFADYSEEELNTESVLREIIAAHLS